MAYRFDHEFMSTVGADGTVTRTGTLETATPKRLRLAREELMAQSKAVLAAGQARGEGATEAELRQVRAAIGEIDALDAEIRAHEGGAWRARFEGPERMRDAEPGTAPRSHGKRYADLFGAVAASLGDWADANEFLATVHQQRSDPRLVYVPTSGALLASATVGVPSDGGFSVPTELVARWMDLSLENEIVRPRADVSAMLSNARSVPGFDASDSSSTLFGGFAGGWVAEGAEITPETPKLRLINLVARKLAILTEVSNELLRDGLSYDTQLSAAITKALGWYLDYGFLNGTGASQPLGVLNSPATIAVAAEDDQTGETAATIKYANIVKMFARLHPACMANAVWVCNNTAIPQLLQLSMSVGTAGSFVPVLSESGGEFRMLTKPVLFTEKVSALGTKGDIGLYDFSQYAVGLRQDMSLDKSSHPGFTRDTSHYRGLLRGDGQPKWSQPYTPKHGDTLSCFVTLATRS